MRNSPRIACKLSKQDKEEVNGNHKTDKKLKTHISCILNSVNTIFLFCF
jgi:hypothetical protein